MAAILSCARELTVSDCHEAMWEGWPRGAATTEGPDMAKTPDVGTSTPDFTLPGVLVSGGTAERGDYTLSAQRGKPVVLAFYPGDNTTVCTKQLCSYTSGLDGRPAPRACRAEPTGCSH